MSFVNSVKAFDISILWQHFDTNNKRSRAWTRELLVAKFFSVRGPSGVQFSFYKRFVCSYNSSILPFSEEPRYPDPFAGAPLAFQQRLADLSSLENETIRWERTRRFKKKNKAEGGCKDTWSSLQQWSFFLVVKAIHQNSHISGASVRNICAYLLPPSEEPLGRN